MATLAQRCLDCLVRDTALCATLNDDDLVELSAVGRRRIVPRGQVVSWSGEPAALCATVVSGVLKLTAATADGREQIVGLLFPGDFLGQLFGNETQLTATTVVDTDLCLFARPAFEHVLGHHPRMERALLERTLASLEEARWRQLSLGQQSAAERVAGFLTDLAARTGVTGDDGTILVTLPLSRGDMASYLGTTIETVSRQFARLKADGVIALDRGGRACRITRPDRLRAIAQPE